MRITNKLNFINSINSSSSAQSALDKISHQISSGMKIRASYDDASIYIDSTRLEYEIKSLEQVKKATTSAKHMTQNSMKSLKDMVELVEKFKIKMTQAASDGNSQTSREAIAKELKRIKEGIVELANTNINGQYLFAGSQVSYKPFDLKGNYYGDKNNINVVTGANTQSPYNIPGWDLFFKADNDYKKEITTNVSLIDRRHDIHKQPYKEKYLDEESVWSYLIGRNYFKDPKNLDVDRDFDYEDFKLDLPPTALFVQGTRPDGSTFRAAVNIDYRTKIHTVLDQIATMYGNTQTNKLVDISINSSGQIQITDLNQGNNKLDFHAVAFTPQFNNKEEYEQIKASLNMQELTNMTLEAAMNLPNTGTINTMPSEVSIMVGEQMRTINLYQSDFIKSRMKDMHTQDPISGADYENTYFEKEDNRVFANISQVIRQSNKYATDSTKLSEVMAARSLDGTNLSLKVLSRGAREYNVNIDLQNSMVEYNQGNDMVRFPIMHTDPNTGNSAVLTPSNEITYRQLNDIIALFVSDNVPETTINANNGLINIQDYTSIEEKLIQAKASVEVNLDYKGRISILDKLSSNTNIQVALADDTRGRFPMPPYDQVQITQGSNFIFNANNALVIDEPNVDFIKDLDMMIEAVLNGDMRANADGKNPRNTGMQGALKRLDHLADHISKLNTTMGAYHNNIEGVNTRAHFLSVNIKEIKSHVVDVDYAQAIMNLMQTQIAYQASLKASANISQLSLLNYI